MKKYILPILAIAAIVSACTKEEKPINDSSNLVEISATIKNEIDGTKTNYDIDGSTATFYWTGVEKIGRLNFYSYPQFWEDEYTSTTQANNKETRLVFSGTPSYSGAYQTDYVMYPIWNGTTKTGIGWSSNPFNLYLDESMEYNADAPLKDVVPMIGKIDDSGEFVFVPVSGIIAVTVKNLPSTATKITLSSSMALSGNYKLTSTPANYASNIDWVINNGLTTGLAYNAGNTTGTKSFTFSGLDRNEHVFYFPVSVAKNGTYDDRYDGMTITIYAEDEVLQTVTSSNKITVEQSQIVRFPLMDLAKATKVKLVGPASAPYAYVEKFGPDAHIKYAIATTENDAKTAAASGAEVSTYGIDNKFSIIPNTGTAGYYYLGYQVVDSDNNVLLTNAVKYCYSASDPSEVIGTYSKTETFVWNTAPATEKVSWTISETDDWTKGNIKLGTSIWNLSSVYGIYDGTKITIDGQNSRFTGNTSHCLAGNWESDTYYSNGIVSDIVFTLDVDGNLTTTKVGIGNSITLSNGLITGFKLTTRFISGAKTWTKE